MKILFLGSGAFGVPTLQSLATTHEIVGVVTQPDRPAGRGRHLTPTPIALWVQSHLQGVPVQKPENVNEAAATAFSRSLGADAFVIIAFGQKLGADLLSGVFAVNLHASLLPRWRGAAPINHAILAGDPVTGNSVITIASRMDAGLVLGRSRRAIEPDVTAGALHDQLAADGPALVRDVLDRHARGTLTPEAQDEAGVTRAGKLSRSDSWVDFSQGREACRCRINGLSPWPGVKVRLGERTLGLVRATRPSEPYEASDGEAHGALVDPRQGLIACADGPLQLLEVQPEGKPVMAWADFANGHQVLRGEIMERLEPC